jgi:hypothetical protein
VVAKLEWQQDELYRRVELTVINLKRPPQRVSKVQNGGRQTPGDTDLFIALPDIKAGL